MRHPPLTRRGWVVVAVAAAALAMGWLFGGRSLNAVVMPAVAVLGLTGVYVARVERPRAARIAPRHGHQGERRTVEVVLECDGSYPVRVRDQLDPALGGDADVRAVTDGRRVSYEVTLGERGAHALGPLAVEATDPLGLWRRTFTYRRTATLVAFPRVHPVQDTGAVLSGYIGVTDERGQFDGVREYRRGDPRRDINWKASAKRPDDLIVTTYAGEGATNHVTVAASAGAPGADVDAVAEAAASIAVHLLDAGVAVSVVTPDGAVPPGADERHEERVLTRLGRLDADSLPRSLAGDADVVVRATGGSGLAGVELVADDVARPYDEVVGRTGVTV